jgi:hypothetical protein
LQALELLTRRADEMGSAQWSGHVLRRLQLTDEDWRKHDVGGKGYAIERHDVMSVMHRYEVAPVEGDTAE